MKTIARYTVYQGLAGCYMPDSNHGAHEFTTRRELAAAIRDYLDMADMPACLFNDVRITRLWSFIKRNGSSSAHFTLTHKGYSLTFSGLTEEEFDQQSADEDY